MKKIIIKSDIDSRFLRTEAMHKALEFEDRLMGSHKEGRNHAKIWKKEANTGAAMWQFLVYHTAKSIVCEVSKVN